MKYLLQILLSFLSLNLYSQNINIYVINNEDCNLVSTIQEYLNQEFDIHTRFVKTNIIESPIGEFIDCNKLNKRLTGKDYFSYDNLKSINIYLTQNRLLWKDLKVNGISYGNNIYLSYKRSDKVKIVLSHELAHTFGAPHCNNQCIMNNDLTPNFTNKIWDQNSDKPIFCNNCSSYWKN